MRGTRVKNTLFPTSVVTKAFTWAYQELGLSIKQASEILGISSSNLAESTLLGFESGSPEYRKQLAFIRMYHLLITVSEGNTDAMRGWFNGFQIDLNTSPYAMCKTQDGIDSVTDLLRSLKQTGHNQSLFAFTAPSQHHALSYRNVALH
ncbi:hypothetical protein BK026_13555 [Alteromonas sp. V450]|nr:hypothetical protein BK026_13555 [Alteromonas sp. V450]